MNPALQAHELSEAFKNAKAHMKRPSNAPSHTCAPKEWRKTPVITGDFDLDETIMHRANTDLPHRLDQHIRKWAYRIRNDYNGYEGMD